MPIEEFLNSLDMTSNDNDVVNLFLNFRLTWSHTGSQSSSMTHTTFWPVGQGCSPPFHPSPAAFGCVGFQDASHLCREWQEEPRSFSFSRLMVFIVINLLLQYFLRNVHTYLMASFYEHLTIVFAHENSHILSQQESSQL